MSEPTKTLTEELNKEILSKMPEWYKKLRDAYLEYVVEQKLNHV